MRVSFSLKSWIPSPSVLGLTLALLVGSQSFTTRSAQAQSVVPWVPGTGFQGNPAFQGQAPQPIEVIQPPASAGAVCPSDLGPAIDRIIGHFSYQTAKWGVYVESLAQSQVLYSRNENAWLIPASNVKLFTTIAALQVISENQKRKWNGFDTEIKITIRDSDNEYADDVLSRIGGVPTVKAQLANLGISPQSFQQVDGSGLSRRNATTPATIAALLKSMRAQPEYEQFYQSLPTAGVSGTLRNLFVNTPIQGLVHAKTGTLTGVRALSG